LTTRDTVIGATPASLATSLSVDIIPIENAKINMVTIPW